MPTRKTLTGMMTAALFVMALPAASFAQDEATEVLDVSPEGVVWSLTSIAGDLVSAEVNASLYMEDGEANGNAGCNSYSGTYTLDGESLVFDPDMAITLALCEGPAQAVEDAYLPLLATVASWAIEGNLLSLADESGSVVLAYEEPIVDVTETGIDALLAELVRLDDRISKTRQDVRSMNIPKTQSQVEQNGVAIAELSKTVENQNVPGLRDRVIANEEILIQLSKTVDNVRSRVKSLEQRVTAIEKQLGTE